MSEPILNPKWVEAGPEKDVILFVHPSVIAVERPPTPEELEILRKNLQQPVTDTWE